MGIPDNYIEHGTRQELLDEVGLNFKGVIDSINKIKKWKIRKKYIKMNG